MSISIPILMYHQVSTVTHPNFREYTVTTEMFTSQMRILKRLGFNPITFNQLYSYKKGTGTLPRKPIIITFDDVLVDAVECAVPILEEFGFKAVFYVPTDFVGRKSSWMIPDVDVEFPVVSWKEIRDLASKGFEIGSHSMTHPHLDKISSENCYRELEGSRKKLEQELGIEIRHMAYPFGEFDESVRELANNAGYYTACAGESYIANSNTHLLSLPRQNVGMSDNMAEFVLKIHFGYTITDVRKMITSRTENLKRHIPKPVRQVLKKLLRYPNSA